MMKNAAKEQPEWGPALDENRTGRYAKDYVEETTFSGQRRTLKNLPMFGVFKRKVDVFENKGYDP